MRKSDVRVKIRNPLTKTFHGGPVYQLGIVLLASIALGSCTQYGGKEPEAAKIREVRSTPPPSPQTLPMESAKDDRSPSSSGRTECPEGFVLIHYPQGGNFCISKTSHPRHTFWVNAHTFCESLGKKESVFYNELHKGSKLCSASQWQLACNQKQNELSMGVGDRSWEWVADTPQTYLVMDCVLFEALSARYGSHRFGKYVSGELGSRCCFDKPWQK